MSEGLQPLLPIPTASSGIWYTACDVVTAAQHLPVDLGDCATDQESWREIWAIT